ncbi:MAG: hypothetical protein GY798_19365 [Hyphomicrobiales bacterium]|nr:hypothetical protein [Hyphomicrobiales bacterium]
MVRLLVAFGFTGFTLTAALAGDDCGRVMLLPSQGQSGLCVTSDCSERSTTRVALTGEIVDACRHGEATWKIETDGDQALFFPEDDLALEVVVDGSPCFSLDLAAGFEADFFDEETRLSGNGKVFDAALELTGRIRSEVSSRVAGTVDVCPTMKHARVATPNPQDSDPDSALPQRMAVSSVLARKDGPANRWQMGVGTNRDGAAHLTVSASLEAYCIDADKRAPESVDSFTLLTGENSSILSNSVEKILANSSLGPEVTLYCIWLSRDNERNPGDSISAFDRDMLGYCRSDPELDPPLM